MRCENCDHIKVFFNGLETETYCEIGISEEEAYNDEKDSYGCRYNKKTIESKFRKMQEVNTWTNKV